VLRFQVLHAFLLNEKQNMIAAKQSVACRALGRRCVPARPFSSSQRSSVVRRFKEDIRPEFAKSNTEELRKDRVQTNNPKEPRLSPEQIEEVCFL
jgi:hypothetical protein